MPEWWDRYVDDAGTVMFAARQTGRFRIRSADGVVDGLPGDYLARPVGGGRRMIPAEMFEARYHLLRDPEEEEARERRLIAEAEAEMEAARAKVAAARSRLEGLSGGG